MITEQSINSAILDRLRVGGDTVLKHGVVLPDEHPSDPSLYKVNIGDMTASSNGRISDGIWCTNGMSPYVRFRDMNNNPVSMGSYTPIVPYTPVQVLFGNGGAGQGTIIGPAKTNVGLPDPENREHLHMVAQTPKNSWIAIDDKTSNIQVMFEGGSSSVVLSENVIVLDIGKGDASGKESDTSLSISKGSFIFRTRDSTMKFDESGFTIGFDANEEQEKSSSFQITRDVIKAQAGKSMQLNASDSISTKSEKVTIEGVKDASMTGNQVKINGAQITSIKGNQIEIEGFWNVQLKGMHIGVQASLMYREESSMKYVKNTTQAINTIGIAGQKASFNNTWVLGTNYTIAAENATTPEILFDQALGALAMPAVILLQEASEAVYEVLKVVGQAWMLKVMPVSVLTNILGTGYAMAGAGNRSENESKFLFNTKDKNSKKNLNTGIATSFTRKNTAMENLSVVDPLIQGSLTALYTGGVAPATTVNPDTQWSLEMGIGGIAEESTRSTGNIMGMDAAGTTMTGSCALLDTNGTCSTLRKSTAGCTGYGGDGEPKQCQEDAYNTTERLQGKAESPFGDKLIKGHLDVTGETATEMVGGAAMGGSHGGGTCGQPGGGMGGSGHGGTTGQIGGGDNAGCGDHGGGGGCASGNSSYANEPCPPGYYRCASGACLPNSTPAKAGDTAGGLGGGDYSAFEKIAMGGFVHTSGGCGGSGGSGGCSGSDHGSHVQGGGGGHSGMSSGGCTNKYQCGGCPSGWRCSEGQCA